MKGQGANSTVAPVTSLTGMVLSFSFIMRESTGYNFISKQDFNTI